MIIQRLIVIDPMVKWLDKFSLGIYFVKFSKIMKKQCIFMVKIIVRLLGLTHRLVEGIMQCDSCGEEIPADSIFVLSVVLDKICHELGFNAQNSVGLSGQEVSGGRNLA